MERNIKLHYTHDNPVPNRISDNPEGQTTKIYVLNENMKFVLCRRNSYMGSALQVYDLKI